MYDEKTLEETAAGSKVTAEMRNLRREMEDMMVVRADSLCHLHIHQHYEIYKEKCEKANIPVSHWAIPQEIWKVMEENKVLEEQGGRQIRRSSRHWTSKV